MDKVRDALLEYEPDLLIPSSQHVPPPPTATLHERRVDRRQEYATWFGRTARYFEDIRHKAHIGKENILQPLRPLYQAIHHGLITPMGNLGRHLVHRYKLTDTHRSIVDFRRGLKTRPPTGYQMHPVIFCVDLDSRSTEKKFRELYDELFLALTSLQHKADGPNSKSEALHYIATADLVLLNHGSLKNANVAIPEKFDVFVAQSADSVVLIAEDITHIQGIVRETFRTVYGRTALRFVPLLCLLINPLAETHDEVWRKRIASVQKMALKDTLLHFGTMMVPHKIYFIRSMDLLEDVERALFWLWRQSGVRERRRAVPLSTSTTRKRWKIDDAPKRRRSSMHTDHTAFTNRRHSILLAANEVVKPNSGKGKRVRINPIPTHLGHKPAAVLSLTDVSKLPQRLHPPRLSRSLSPTSLAGMRADHPDLFQDLLDLQKSNPHRRPSLVRKEMILLMAQEAAVRNETAALAAIQSANLAKALLDQEAERAAREKFVRDEKKYIELKEYNKQLQLEQNLLRGKIDALVEFVKKTAGPLAAQLPSTPMLNPDEMV